MAWVNSDANYEWQHSYICTHLYSVNPLDGNGHFGYYVHIMNASVFTAKEAKNNFGRLIDEARQRPVAIKKHGRRVAMVLSVEAYDEFEAARDSFWGAAAAQAEKNGFVGTTRSARILKQALDASH